MGDGLTYTSDDEPGIARRGTKRFRYYDTVTGREVGARTKERIEALAIPPAWRDVWICRDADGHLQATGRDARDRKQYRYHPRFRQQRDAEKFADLIPFGEALGPLRRRLREDLDGREWDFDHVLAVVLALLDTTHVRVGNDHYARENGTFGLTTLRDRHAAPTGRRLHFIGKGGKEHDVPIDDPLLAREIRRCRQLSGQRLFQWIDVRGERHPVRSNDVNERLRELTGIDATAKTFRTWGATVRAATLLGNTDPPESEREAKRAVLDAVDEVAEHLGDTRTVARASYVHPIIPAAFESGQLSEWWEAGPTRAGHGLERDERRLLHVLGRARRTGLGLAPTRRAA
jgi:DNA topoisomerase-1